MIFDFGKFKALFPEFGRARRDEVAATRDQALCYVSDACKGECANQLLMLLVAHLMRLRKAVADGGGLAITSASEGSVSVSMAMPASADAKGQWLNITPYGQQYAALEAKCAKGRAAAGLYFGNLPEGKGFRKIGGMF